MMRQIIHGDCVQVLPALPEKFARLIYVDPPFNTGKMQSKTTIRSTSSKNGVRNGFGGRKYDTEVIAKIGYVDKFDDYVEEFLMPRIKMSLRCLTDDGSIFVHLDYREVHYVKVAMDRLLGRDHFMNEIIWAYDFGGRSKKRWAAKHDTILWYAMNPDNYVFNFEEIKRIPYMAPGLVSVEKAKRGKVPTDTWWHTIVPTNGKEKTGYPNQKPLGILNRIILAHSNKGDTVLDFFAGSGSTAYASAELGRDFVMVDSNKKAIDIMRNRLDEFNPYIMSECKVSRAYATL